MAHQPVGPRQGQHREAEGHHHQRLGIGGAGQHDEFPGHRRDGGEKHQLNLHRMALQIGRDVLQQLQGDQDVEQLAEKHDQRIALPDRLPLEQGHGELAEKLKA